jgi:hypothetical protein
MSECQEGYTLASNAETKNEGAFPPELLIYLKNIELLMGYLYISLTVHHINQFFYNQLDAHMFYFVI